MSGLNLVKESFRSAVGLHGPIRHLIVNNWQAM